MTCSAHLEGTTLPHDNRIHLYKTHVLSYAECRIAAICGASVSLLKQVGLVQESFLEDAGIDVIDVLLIYNLAPLYKLHEYTDGNQLAVVKR